MQSIGVRFEVRRPTAAYATFSHKGRRESPLFGGSANDLRTGICFDPGCGSVLGSAPRGECVMSLGTILVIILIIILLGGFSGRIRGRGRSGMGLIGVILIVLLILLLLGKI
jgi:hypothetical protein